MAVGLLDRPVRSQPPAPARRGLRPGRTPRPDPEQERLHRLAGAQALLARARALVDAGWVQDAFYVVRGRRGEVRPVSPFGLLLLDRSDVVGACLVGAVAHASSSIDRRERRSQAALAVDALWEALADAPADTSHPSARPARVRELARWNDEPGRSREDVLDLLDRAAARTVLTAAR